MAVLDSIQFELSTVEEQIKKEFGFKALGIIDITQLKMNNLDQYLLPAISLAVAKTAGSINDIVISLSIVLQYVYMAQYIHGMVKDTEMTDAQRQYPILVGDYVFGQSFVKVCEEDLFPYAKHFVVAIKKVNEGIVRRWRLKNQKMSVKDYKSIIEKERASLTALAARLGAEKSNIKPSHIDKFETLGYNIGMAWAASLEPKFNYLVQEYFSKIRTNINDLREHYTVKSLQELYDFIRQESKIEINDYLATYRQTLL
ncbi:MAG: hypothetical protein GX091_03165 [Peptococcaceae bacterium]|nr:hypothetical protein [Peptococcaceae bacterium]